MYLKINSSHVAFTVRVSFEFLLSVFEISLVCHLVAVFEIKFSVYKQTIKHTTNQPYRRHIEKISRSALLSAAGATKNSANLTI